MYIYCVYPATTDVVKTAETSVIVSHSELFSKVFSHICVTLEHISDLSGPSTLFRISVPGDYICLFGCSRLL